MKLKNYDSKDRVGNPRSDDTLLGEDFRMLICGQSGCGKTNTLMNILNQPNMCYYDQIIIYTPNAHQDKMCRLIKQFALVSEALGYPALIIETAENIVNTDAYCSDDCVKLVVFDDLVNCDKKTQAKIANHYTDGRHHRISPIYLSQSYFDVPKKIRTNCTKMILYKPNVDDDKMRISKESRFDKGLFDCLDKHDFLYVDQQSKTVKKNFDEDI